MALFTVAGGVQVLTVKNTNIINYQLCIISVHHISSLISSR